MNKKGILPAVLVTLVGLAGLTVLILGTLELVHGSLTGAAPTSSLPEPNQNTLRLPTVIVQQPDGRETLENCFLIPTSRAGTYRLQCTG